jgi:membrane protein
MAAMVRRALQTFINELRHALVVHRVKDTAAMLGFWSLLAIFPFMIFVLSVMGFLPLAGLEREVLDLVNDVMPDQAAQLFDRTLREIVHRQRGGLLVISLFGALWTASSGMNGAMAALNLAHGVAETRPWWQRRLLGIGMTAAAAACVTVACVFLLIGPNLIRAALEALDRPAGLTNFWRWARYPIATAVLIFMLGNLYHFLPNKKLKWRFWTLGTLTAVALFIGASLGFNQYVSHFHNYAKTYGALGTAVILLFWLYLSSLMLLLGAEIDTAVARTREVLEKAASATPEQVKRSPQIEQGGL